MNITMTQAAKIASTSHTKIYDGYSGRGMYGETCVGFTVRNSRNAAALTAAIVRTLDDDVADAMIGRLNTDSLGMGTIVYFPGISIAKEV
jgi:hypothetical protein